jgi:structural maintenance of chromosome 2
VSGPLVGLIRVKEPTKTSIALEIGAGPKLHYIVVDSQETGRALLEKGELAQRVTFVPLSQIVRQVTSSEVLKRAQSLVGSENVTHALSLVDYKPEHAPAAEYAFGNLLVAQGPEQAKRVTFDPQVMTRTVTLEGDVFDPQGTLTGGSLHQSGQSSLLVRLHELQLIKDQLQQHETQARDLDAQLAQCAALKAQYGHVQHEMELAAHALELLEARIAQTEHHQLVQRVAELTRLIAEDTRLIAAAQTREHESTRLCEELEELLNTFDQATQLKRIAEQLKKTRGELDKLTKRAKKTQQSVVQLTSEIDELTAELRTVQQQCAALEAQCAQLQRDVERVTAQFSAQQAEYEQLKRHADKKRGKYLQCDKTIGELMVQRDKQTTLLADHEVQIKTLEHRITSHHGKKKAAEKRYKQLLDAHSWIANEKQFFGKPKTDYDFNNRDVRQVELKLKTMEEEQDRLAKTINKKVMNMFSK